MTKYIFLSFLMLFLNTSCRSKVVKKDQQEQYTYEFGEYGGFAGTKTIKSLDKEGRVFQLLPSISGTDSVLLGQLADSSRENLSTLTVKALKIEGIKEVGNMNAYLKIYRNDSLLKEHEWPLGKKDLPTEIRNLYDLINGIKK